MRRIYCAFIAIFTAWFFMPLFVSAVGESVENDNGNGWAYVTHINYAAGDASYTADIYTNNRVFLYANPNGNQSYYYYYCAGDLTDNNRAGTLEISANNQNFNIQNNGNIGSGRIVTSNNGGVPTWNWTALVNRSLHSSFNPDMPVFDNLEDGYNYSISTDIDFDNIYYSPNIPLPDMDVFYLLSSNIGDRVAMWNANMNIQDNNDFYIQYGIKLSVPGIVGIGLDSTTGNYTYSYDEYSEGSYIDIISLDSLTPCVDISFGSEDYQSSWQSAYDVLYDTVPEFYAKIPFWQQNPSAAKYVSAQTYYKDNMMNQMPMFGNRLEIFARLFTVNEDSQVIVGDWLHWSSRTGSRTQEKPSNYIDNVELPGYVNSSNNVNFESQDNTYQQSGEAIGAPSTVINNNYAPNYPDYPTIASYNKDNLLLDTMGYMSNMNNFLSGPNGFGHFLTEVFTFIPSYVWGMVAMGFGVAIIVMFIKIL